VYALFDRDPLRRQLGELPEIVGKRPDDTGNANRLSFEEEAAQLLDIPYNEVMQVALIPVAYTKGTDFKPVLRRPVHEIVHWETW
jgi:hypothetical protein